MVEQDEKAASQLVTLLAVSMSALVHQVGHLCLCQSCPLETHSRWRLSGHVNR